MEFNHKRHLWKIFLGLRRIHAKKNPLSEICWIQARVFTKELECVCIWGGIAQTDNLFKLDGKNILHSQILAKDGAIFAYLSGKIKKFWNNTGGKNLAYSNSLLVSSSLLGILRKMDKSFLWMPSQAPSTIHLQVALPLENLTESEKCLIIMNLDDSSHSSLQII